MTNAYITAGPCELADFLAAAKDEGFTVMPHAKNPAFIQYIEHDDGRGCYEIAEEEHECGTYVGSMGNPELYYIEMVAEGTPEYLAICADEYDDE